MACFTLVILPATLAAGRGFALSEEERAHTLRAFRRVELRNHLLQFGDRPLLHDGPRQFVCAAQRFDDGVELDFIFGSELEGVIDKLFLGFLAGQLSAFQE